eukprot:GHVU01214465.1.p1 GENE.GHVU01214465.1~~GHVU01214465.1.p1  ORF type:complete len:201 (-),score=1.08 GHVU01214465.1:1274-1876(-)
MIFDSDESSAASGPGADPTDLIELLFTRSQFSFGIALHSSIQPGFSEAPRLEAIPKGRPLESQNSQFSAKYSFAFFFTLLLRYRFYENPQKPPRILDCYFWLWFFCFFFITYFSDPNERAEKDKPKKPTANVAACFQRIRMKFTPVVSGRRRGLVRTPLLFVHDGRREFCRISQYTLWTKFQARHPGYMRDCDVIILGRR